MRLVAKDEVLGTALDAPPGAEDIYQLDARAAFLIPPGEPVKKAARHQSKIIHLSWQYGAGLLKIHQTVLEKDRSIRLETTRFVTKALAGRYLRTVAYWDEEFDRVCKAGFSESRILGRRKYYPRPPDKKEISGIVNYPIQSTAADLSSLALISLRAELRASFGANDAKIVCYLYDAFDVDCRLEIRHDVGVVMKRVMEAPVEVQGYGVYSFPVEIKGADLEKPPVVLWSQA